MHHVVQDNFSVKAMAVASLIVGIAIIFRIVPTGQMKETALVRAVKRCI